MPTAHDPPAPLADSSSDALPPPAPPAAASDLMQRHAGGFALQYYLLHVYVLLRLLLFGDGRL